MPAHTPPTPSTHQVLIDLIYLDVARLLARHGLTGWTVLRGATGRGDSGARYADELNVDWLSPAELTAARPIIASRCEEIGRDPGSLRLSVNIGRDDSAIEGPPRVGLLRAYADVGVDRVMTLIRASADDDGALERFADDCVAAGCDLEGA